MLQYMSDGSHGVLAPKHCHVTDGPLRPDLWGNRSWYSSIHGRAIQ